MSQIPQPSCREASQASAGAADAPPFAASSLCAFIETLGMASWQKTLQESSAPPVASGDSAPVRRRRKAARPSELVAAALGLFVERGFAATRLDEVAARAGVSKGTLYLYFDSKEALFKSVVEESLVPALAAAEQWLAQYEGSATDSVRELLVGWWVLLGETPLAGMPKLIIAEAGNFPELAKFYHERVIVRGRALMRTVLERGIARGEFRPLDIEIAIDVIFSPILMLLIWRHSMVGMCGYDYAPATYLETHMNLLINGLCADSRTGTAGASAAEGRA